MTPEAQTRSRIDTRLQQAGWAVQDMKQLDLGAAPGVAVREYPTDGGPADYVLFVDRQPVGIIEAKRDAAGEHITAVQSQTARYAVANLKWRTAGSPRIRGGVRRPDRLHQRPAADERSHRSGASQGGTRLPRTGHS